MAVISVTDDDDNDVDDDDVTNDVTILNKKAQLTQRERTTAVHV